MSGGLSIPGTASGPRFSINIYGKGCEAKKKRLNSKAEFYRVSYREISQLLPCVFQMRFLNCRKGRKDPSKSILDVGVEEAIKFSGFDEQTFLKRGGKYVWSKADLKLDW